MAQIEINTQKKSKRYFHFEKSARIDFTPMVDLGFLLITFFVFTAKMNEPKAMKLFMPKDDSTHATPVKCSASLTLLLLKNGKIGWYDCKNGESSPIQYTSLQSDNGLRMLLQQKQDEIKRIFGDVHDLVVIIKPFENSDYKTLVDLLDEMTINDVTRYAIVEADLDDIAGAVD